MKLNAKVAKIGIAAGVILVALGIIGVKFNIPILSSGVNYVLYPFEKGITWVSHSVQNGVGYFEDINRLKAENEALKQENSQLVYKNTILNQYQEENNSLKELLDLKQLYVTYKGIGANVIGNDSGNWYKVFTIDKGTKNGVHENSVILANGGLVGHVVEHSGLAASGSSIITSKVISIIDSRSVVSAEVVRTGDVGIVKGDVKLSKQGLCKLEINIESEVVKGDQIITSQISPVYPPGILIGTVEEIEEDNNGLTRYAYVRPVVDFKHLKQVLILDTSGKNS